MARIGLGHWQNGGFAGASANLSTIATCYGLQNEPRWLCYLGGPACFAICHSCQTDWENFPIVGLLFSVYTIHLCTGWISGYIISKYTEYAK